MKPTALPFPLKPILTRTKAIAAFGILASSLWWGSPRSHAATYNGAIPENTTLAWQAVNWSGGPGAYPSTGDTASITKATGRNSVLNLMAGDFTLANLIYNGGDNQLRLRNYGTLPADALPTNLTITSALTVGGGTLVLTKVGNGHQFSIETASTSVANGAILRLGIGGASIAFASGQTTINQGGTIELYAKPSGTGIDLGALTNNGTLDLLSGTTATTDAYEVEVASLSGSSESLVTTTNTGSGTAPLPTLKISGNHPTAATYNGVISGTVGKIAVAKEGSGTQIFSNANTYTGGTKITEGVLAVTNTSGSGLGSGPVEISQQGTLSGNGIVALTNETLHVTDGGHIAPGAFEESGFSTLKLSGETTTTPILTMEEGTSFTFRLGAGNQSDQVEFLSFETGDWVINGTQGVSINVTDAGIGLYTLFSFKDAGGNAIASGLSEGLIAGTGLEGYTVLFHYANTPGTSDYGTITMEVIPEPGMVTLSLLGGALLLYGLRSRQTAPPRS